MGRNLFIIGFGLMSMFFNIGTTSAQVSIQKPKIYSEVSGNFRGDYRYFPEDALYPGQHQEYFSTLFQPEIYLEWNKGKQLLQFTGFARLDQYDTKRTHADIRELYWQSIFKKWELSIGVKKIFWGVTESNHLVDIINQTDVLELSSNQFKQITGFRPLQFRTMLEAWQSQIDRVKHLPALSLPCLRQVNPQAGFRQGPKYYTLFQ